MSINDMRTTLTIAKDFTPSIIRAYERTERDPFFLFIETYYDEEFDKTVKFYLDKTDKESLYQSLQKRFSPGYEPMKWSPGVGYEQLIDPSFDCTRGLDKHPQNNPSILVVSKQRNIISYKKNLGALIAILEQIFRIVKIVEITKNAQFNDFTTKYPTSGCRSDLCVRDSFDFIVRHDCRFGRIPRGKVDELYNHTTGRKFIKKNLYKATQKKERFGRGRLVPY